MKFLRIAIFTCFCSALRLSAACCDHPCLTNWYALVGSGYAFSLTSHVATDPFFWDFANEGYNNDLGESPFFSIGVGKKFWEFFEGDLTYSYYQTFHYQKYQTGSSPSPGFTGTARTRFFDLDHQNFMFNFNLDLKADWLFYQIFGIQLSPLIGGGVGLGVSEVSNFHTAAFVPLVVGSTTSIGSPVTTSTLAWQVNFALRFQKCCSKISFDFGYRFYDGGHLKGPSHVAVNTIDFAGAQIDSPAWDVHFRANEIFFNTYFWF